MVMIGTDKSLYEDDGYISEQVITIAKTSTIPLLIVPNHIRYKKITEALVPCDFAAILRLSALKGFRDPQKWLHPKLLLLNTKFIIRKIKISFMAYLTSPSSMIRNLLSPFPANTVSFTTLRTIA